MKLIDLYKYDITSVTLEAPLRMTRSVFRDIPLREKYATINMRNRSFQAICTSYSRAKKKQYVSAMFSPSSGKAQDGRAIFSYTRSDPSGLPLRPIRGFAQFMDQILRHSSVELGKFQISIHFDFQRASRDSWAVDLLDVMENQVKIPKEKSEGVLSLSGARFRGVGKGDFISTLIIEGLPEHGVHIYFETKEFFTVDTKNGVDTFFDESINAATSMIDLVYSSP